MNPLNKLIIAVSVTLFAIAAAAYAQYHPAATDPCAAADPCAVADPCAAAPSSEIPDVQTIVERANIMAYYQGDNGRANVEMVVTNRQGNQRRHEFTILRKDIQDGGDQNYYVYFRQPPDARRTAYLVLKHAAEDRDDDRWLYEPSLDLIRRIAATDKRTSFVGSDYLYEDVSGRSLTADTHQLTETTDEYFIVRNTPVNPDSVEFSYFDVWIRRDNYMPYKMMYYDSDDQLYRTIEALEIQTIQDYPTVVHSIVRNLTTESTTEMRFSNVQYNINIGDIFQERYLRRPPREVR
ncbi:MAG: outer membrane lipoprotein-sorting protein [Sedimentisphaerales bacterium]|nr:outer membrane lipoprotein-sorting protein [Sedimentisphaerales bacterium]